jgi:hypothetical protein
MEETGEIRPKPRLENSGVWLALQRGPGAISPHICCRSRGVKLARDGETLVRMHAEGLPLKNKALQGAKGSSRTRSHLSYTV